MDEDTTALGLAHAIRQPEQGGRDPALDRFGAQLANQVPGHVQAFLDDFEDGQRDGGLLPLAFTIVGSIFSLEQRAKTQGLFSGVWGVSSVVGPVVGGFLNDHIAPSAIWYGGALFAACAAVGFSLLSRRPERENNVAVV